MSSNAPPASRKTPALLALVVFAGLAAAFALYSRGAVASARRSGAEALDRLAEDRELAARYERLSHTAVAVSANITEARSTDFLGDALRRNGLTPEISPGDPKKGSGDYDKVETTITLENVSLLSVVNFLWTVESGRENLSLLRARLMRDDRGDDLWSGDLTYGALIPARSRN